MEPIFNNIELKINEYTFVKNPISSDLGKRILKGSIHLIDEMGFEEFTFKKLATYIESTEASVYRYFENKHKLLLYLTNWYWSWMLYRLQFATANLQAEEKITKALHLLIEPVSEDQNFEHINEVKLYHIIVNDASKSYLTQDVDKENKEGVFQSYKSFVASLSSFISEFNPDFKNPNMLISTVIEGIHHQKYFIQHLPLLSESDAKKGNCLESFFQELIFKTIAK